MLQWLLWAAVGLGAVALLLVAAAYVLLPILVNKTQYHLVHKSYDPLVWEYLPADAGKFFVQTLRVLEAEGFRPAASFRQAETVPGTTTYAVLAPNYETSDMATAAFIVAKAEGVNLRSATVVIETKFDDGRSVETGNFAEAGTFPADPRRNRLHIPGFGDVALLCEIHRRRRQKFAPPGAKPVLPPPGGEVEHQMEEDAGELGRVADAGYLYLDETGEKYRATLKGAYLMTWKLMYPVSALRRAAKRWRARRQLRTLGLDPALLNTTGPA